MVYKQKGKFELKESVLQNIIDDILKQPKNQGVVAHIQKSNNKNSKSLYVMFYMGDCTTALRISDHYCKGHIRNVVVGESTGVSNIYYKIDSAIKDLKFKRLNDLLNKV